MNTANIIERTAKQTIELSFAYSDEDARKEKDFRRWFRWDWSIGVAFYGLWKVFDRNGDRNLADSIKKWIDLHINEIDSVCVNTCALLPSVARIYDLYGGKNYADLINTFDNYVMVKADRVPSGAIAHSVIGNTLDGQVWADTLFMSVLYLAERAVATGKQEYADEVYRQLRLHVESLYDDGLFYHGWDDRNRMHMGVKWGRGNAWVTVSTVEIIDLLGKRFPEMESILCRLRAQVESLSKYQDSTGMWRTVIDDPKSYFETSVTAGVAYSVLKGIRLNLLDKSYSVMAEKAVMGLISKIDDRGNVEGGSTGTPIKESPDAYNSIPIRVTPFTQGLALMALCEADEI